MIMIVSAIIYCHASRAIIINFMICGRLRAKNEEKREIYDSSLVILTAIARRTFTSSLLKHDEVSDSVAI